MYYAVTGLPSLFLTGAKAIYAMRILSGLLSAAFVAVALVSLAGLRMWRLPLFVGSAALTPMVFFLSGAVNPNSLEIATSMSVFAALCLTWDRLEAGRAWKGPMAAAALSAVVLANTRAASLLWLALAVIASLLLFGYRPLLSALRQRFGWTMVGVVAVGCAMSLLWLRVANSLQNLMGQGIDAGPVQIATIMLDRTFEFAVGYVSFLGWLDTPGPPGTLAVWATLIIGSIVVALSVADRAGRITVACLTAAVIFLPALLQIPLAKDVGLIWQGRYILALVVVLVTACGVAMRSFSIRQSGIGRRASVIVLSLLRVWSLLQLHLRPPPLRHRPSGQLQLARHASGTAMATSVRLDRLGSALLGRLGCRSRTPAPMGDRWSRRDSFHIRAQRDCS